ncbi:hypothetical protein HYV82_03720 [Candidatus Woesearchaeota archaeon]|nr:hypothetical protein [Candidatus Woesearchaeota archaeon]
MPIDDLIIVTISGTAIPLGGDDTDTDTITPADAMKEPTFANSAGYLFRDARKANPRHPLNNHAYDGASILIVGRNFGIGSSRETAPQAIQRYGINALVGESFGPIFAGTCKSLGMPAVTSAHDDVALLMQLTERNPGTIYTLDLTTKTLAYDGGAVPIEIPEPTRVALMTGSWNALAMLKANSGRAREVAAGLPYMRGFAE